MVKGCGPKQWGEGKDEEEKQIPDPSNKASLFLSLRD